MEFSLESPLETLLASKKEMGQKCNIIIGGIGPCKIQETRSFRYLFLLDFIYRHFMLIRISLAPHCVYKIMEAVLTMLTCS